MIPDEWLRQLQVMMNATRWSTVLMLILQVHDEAGGKDEEAECRVEVRSNGEAGGVEDGGDRVGEENRKLAGFE